MCGVSAIPCVLRWHFCHKLLETLKKKKKFRCNIMCNNWLHCLLFFCSSSSQLQQQLLDLRSEDYNIRKLFFICVVRLQIRQEEKSG